MTTISFSAARFQIDKDIQLLRDTEERLKREFIKENAKFKLHNTVLLEWPSGYKERGIVNKIDVNHYGEIQYELVFCKRNGDPGTRIIAHSAAEENLTLAENV